MHAQVAHDLLDAVVGEVAVAAMELEAPVGDARAGLGDEELGHGAEARGVGRAPVELPGRLAQQHARGLEIGLGLRQPELERLELGQRPAEGVALAHVEDRRVERRLRGAQGAGGDVEPAAVEPRHGVAEALALLAEQVGGRRARLVELGLPRGLRAPAHLVLQRAEGEAPCAVLHQHGRDASGALLAGAAHHDVGVGVAPAGDEGLGAGKAPALVVAHRPRAQRRGVRARAGLGQAVGQHRVHRDRARQGPRAQLVRAEAVHHRRAHVVDRQERGDRRAGHRQGLEHQRRVEPREPRAAHLLGDVEAPEAQGREVGPKRAWDLARGLPLAGVRRDALRAHLAGGVEDRRLLLGQREVHAGLRTGRDGQDRAAGRLWQGGAGLRRRGAGAASSARAWPSGEATKAGRDFDCSRSDFGFPVISLYRRA